MASGGTKGFHGTTRKLPDYDGGGEDPNLIKHEFMLRSDFKLKLELPNNFNHDDLNRLTRWLNIIPFD